MCQEETYTVTLRSVNGVKHGTVDSTGNPTSSVVLFDIPGDCLPEDRKFNVNVVNFVMKLTLSHTIKAVKDDLAAQFVEIRLDDLYQPNNYDTQNKGSSTKLCIVRNNKISIAGPSLVIDEDSVTIVKPSSNNWRVRMIALNDGEIYVGPSTTGNTTRHPFEYVLTLQFKPIKKSD